MRPSDDFAGRVAWVTGAAQGMGARHAERLAAAGARVGCIDVSDGVAALAERIRSGGGSAEAVVADVGDWEALSSAAERLRNALGSVEIVVANAGILGEFAAVEELEPAAWDRVIAVNLTGVFFTAKAALPQLRERGGGAMVLVSSVSGLRGYAGMAAYNAAKHGVIGLMRTLANELAGAGVRVNAICPSWVDTGMFDAQAAWFGLTREEMLPRAAPEQLIERLVTPDEVSDAVLWLASDAAAMITGVALPVDGGMLERTLPPPQP